MSVWNRIAEQQIVAPRKAQLRAAEKRKQKALAERDLLFRMWQKWHAERREKLLNGPYHVAARQLINFLERMTSRDGEALLALIEAGPWRDADDDAKFLVLSLIDGDIAHLRERKGLPPFNDSLDDDDLTVFQLIREMLI